MIAGSLMCRNLTDVFHINISLCASIWFFTILSSVTVSSGDMLKISFILETFDVNKGSSINLLSFML